MNFRKKNYYDVIHLLIKRIEKEKKKIKIKY